MPKRFNNWTYNDVTSFLRDNGFVVKNQRGSHVHFIAYKNGHFRTVTVPYRGNSEAINLKTLKSAIRQSGIDQKDWVK